MDPALVELISALPGNAEAEVVLRLDEPAAALPGVRIVSRFGLIATCRVRVDAIMSLRETSGVASVKAPRVLLPEAATMVPDAGLAAASDQRRPDGLRYTGAGCVLGLLDWGFDPSHPSVRDPSGRTRIKALWDQRRSDPRRPNRYGYGVVHSASMIDAALRSADPFRALGYHPAESDPQGIGSHGTHTMSIAAGNGLGGDPEGMAPGVDIVCVHLGSDAFGSAPFQSLGDSVKALEAVDFIRSVAAGRPFVISASIGRHGGPHDGTTLFELAIDEMLTTNGMVVHSVGNYRQSRTHASGTLRGGETRTLRFEVDPADRTENELEIWYDGAARLDVVIESPDGLSSPSVLPGARMTFDLGRASGIRVFHRIRDPQNASNLIDCFFPANMGGGEWRVHLRAPRANRPVSFHAWLERDDSCRACQPRFHPDDADESMTTSTLANGRNSIAVGAIDAHDPSRAIASFSSVGPTRGREARSKPDCLAPGVRVLGARSTARGGQATEPTARRTGTSMAAPHVAGIAALVLEAGRGRLSSPELREILLTNTTGGVGELRVEPAIEQAARIARRRDVDPARSFIHTIPRGTQTMKQRGATLATIAEDFIDESPRPRPENLFAALASATNLPERDVADLFNAIVRSREVAAPVEVVVGPGTRARSRVRPGDILIRRPGGERGLTHVAVIADEPVARAQLEASRVTLELGGDGDYAIVVEGGARPRRRYDRFARRVSDRNGLGLAGQVIVRFAPAPTTVETEPKDSFEEALTLADCRKTPPAEDVLMVGGVGYAVPGLKVRNWRSPGVNQFTGAGVKGVCRDPQKVNTVVLHETRGPAWRWSEAVRRTLDQRNLAIHGFIDYDGTLIQHADLLEHVSHGEPLNTQSVGFEIMNPMWDNPAVPRDRPPRDRIPCMWDREAKDHYLVPSLEQLDAVVALVRWLGGDPLRIMGWPGVVNNRFMVIPPADGGAKSGVIGHGQFKRTNKSDGIFPALYAYLVIERNYASLAAYDEAKRLLSEPISQDIALPDLHELGASRMPMAEAVTDFADAIAADRVWSRYFPLEAGTKFTVDGPLTYAGTGTVHTRTDDVLVFEMNMPAYSIPFGDKIPKADMTFSITYRNEGSGNQLEATINGVVYRDPNLRIQSDDKSGRRSFFPTIQVPGFAIGNVSLGPDGDDANLKMTINGREVGFDLER